MVTLEIGAIKEASTIDYPGEMVAVVYLCGCNFKCPFCQNASLVLKKDCISRRVEAVADQLASYRKYITGICFTGGEPTLQFEGLLELLKKTHKKGLLNKLDTNGFYANRIKQILSQNLLDYVAIDVKSALIPENYGKLIGIPSLGEMAVKRITETLEALHDSHIPYETRTTIVPTLNDSEQEIAQISEKLKSLKVNRYILQQFRASGGTLDEEFSKIPATDHDLLLNLAQIAQKNIKDVRIRTIEAGEEVI